MEKAQTLKLHGLSILADRQILVLCSIINTTFISYEGTDRTGRPNYRIGPDCAGHE